VWGGRQTGKLHVAQVENEHKTESMIDRKTGVTVDDGMRGSKIATEETIGKESTGEPRDDDDGDQVFQGMILLE